MKKALRYVFGFLFVLVVALMVALIIDRQNKPSVTFLPANSVLCRAPK